MSENEIFLKITFSGDSLRFISFLRQCISTGKVSCPFKNAFSCWLQIFPDYAKNSMVLHGIRIGCVGDPHKVKDWFAAKAKDTGCCLVSFFLQEDVPTAGIFRDWIWPIPTPFIRSYRSYMKGEKIDPHALIGLCIDNDEYIEANMMGYDCKEHFSKALMAVMKGKICDVPFYIIKNKSCMFDKSPSYDILCSH